MGKQNKCLTLIITLLFVVTWITGCSSSPITEASTVTITSTDRSPTVTVLPSSTITPAPSNTPEPTNTPSPYPTTPIEERGARITIVFNNIAYDSRLTTSWGFAAFIEYDGHVLLFDTGGSGSILLENMEQLDLDPQRIEIVVLSHIHGDHTDGLIDLLYTGVKPIVYLPKAFPEPFKYTVQVHTELVEVREPIEILPGVYSTGELGTLVEQALILETAEGMVIITGCAHPGVVRMIRKARSILEGDVTFVTGGFHLDGSSRSQLENIIEDFRSLEVKQVGPSHCTGDLAIGMFEEEYGDDFIDTGLGRVIVIGPEPAE
ncbi:MAG: MBL fold metallo-hydrolase [Anaerolineaceae bacterium]|nr:MAG: MBL fold metallo-hydrolase [Anaerolineaceae bacterium]